MSVDPTVSRGLLRDYEPSDGTFSSTSIIAQEAAGARAQGDGEAPECDLDLHLQQGGQDGHRQGQGRRGDAPLLGVRHHQEHAEQAQGCPQLCTQIHDEYLQIIYFTPYPR